MILKELDDLKKAIEAKRFDGRIAAIRKAFKAYKESLIRISWHERIMNCFSRNRGHDK